MNVYDQASSSTDRSRNHPPARSSLSMSHLGGWATGEGSTSGPFGQQPYVPGYLMSSTTSVGGPSYPAPPLIPEPFAGKRPASTASQFGADPFVSSLRASSNARSPVPDVDDENAPPTNSLFEGLSTPDPKRAHRSSTVGGFHPSTPSPPVPQTLAPSASTSLSPRAATAVIVFGFPPELKPEIVHHFASFGDIVAVDPPSDTPQLQNWVTISYRNTFDATRAVRKNGDLINTAGKDLMIGVKWADPSSIEGMTTPSAEIPSRPSMNGINSNIGTPVVIAPSSSAFRGLQTGASASRGSGWDLALKEASKKQEPASDGGGIFSKISDLVFGW